MCWQRIKKDCFSINGAQSVRLEKETIEFRNYFKQIPVPFKIYADFESNLKAVKIYEGFYSKKYQDHVPCSFAYKFVCIDDKFTKPIDVFRGKNAPYGFVKAILKKFEYCKKVMKKHFNKNSIMSEEKEEHFQTSNTCWISEKLNDNDDEKVREHCQITGKFRGAGHWSCNINLQLAKKVPVIFHNLRGYDSHLIFHKLNRFNVKIDVTPNGLEKYMTFFLNKNLVFIGSMQFMNTSLDKLVKNITDEHFKYLTEKFGSKILELLKEKGAYPYEYMNSFKTINQEKLPDKKCFYRSTKDGTAVHIGENLDGYISDEDYLTWKKIWNEFNIKIIGDYHDHYLKKDVLLLADVFEKFIDTCLKSYGLNLCHYVSYPGLSWNAMLKMTGVGLEKMSDIDMYLFIEKGLRGGISYIAKRYAKANNKYMKEYDPKKLSKFLISMVGPWVVIFLMVDLSG